MDFSFTEEEEAFRQEVRQWLTKEIPQRWYELNTGYWEETDESWAVSRDFHRKLGERGWLAPAFPRKYGGAEMSTTKRFILSQELAHHRAPVGVEVEEAVNWVGPAILMFGSGEQKQKYIPAIARGDIVFCIGYSEPNAGSDLASLQTRATEVSDGYIINGQKIWTTIAHYADYCWLATRTDPTVSKHRGISMLVVDMRTPGITVRPLINILGHHSFNEVFFDDVHVPKDSLIGQKNQGWYQLAAALDFERSSFIVDAFADRTIEELVQYAKETECRGKPLAKDPLIRQELAQAVIENQICRMMSCRLVSIYAKGKHPNVEASMSFLTITNLTKRMMNVGMRITGLYGLLEKDSCWAVLNGEISRLYLTAASVGVGGGTTEIQRNIIALRGLGLPLK